MLVPWKMQKWSGDKERGQPAEAGKDKEMDSPLVPQERNKALLTQCFSSVRTMPDF